LNGIVGVQTQAKAISIGVDDDMDSCRAAIFTAIKDVGDGSGVVLLTDMYGGTPSNLAIAAMPRSHAVVLAGVNLPMLVKLASIRTHTPLLEAVREAEMAGRKYIQLVSETLAPTSAA
jgi:PTS system mannose-specific IIA component